MWNSIEQLDALAICCYKDRGGAQVTSIVDVGMYEPEEVRWFAEKVYTYVAEHHRAPKDLFMNMITDLKETHPDSEDTLNRLCDAIVDAEQNINEDYTIPKMRRFVRDQGFKIILRRVLDKFNANHDTEEAVTAITAFKDKRDDTIDGGLDFNTIKKYVGPHHRDNGDVFETGIEMLDRRRIQPVRKEMMMFVAPAKAGKTLFLSQLGKRAMLQHKRVCHVTLEMPQDQIRDRYLQSMTNLTRRETITRTKLIVDDRDHFVDYEMYEDVPDVRFATDAGDAVVNRFLRRFKNRMPLKVKEFSRLTVTGLRKWLLSLNSVANYTPDLLLVDYPDLMVSETREKEYRIQLEHIVVGLRAIATEWNCAMVVASQTNREGSTKTTVTASSVAESWGKIATFDKGIFFSQTEAEKKCQLARLGVMGREVEGDISVLISQCYDTKTFCTGSCYYDEDHYPPRS